MNVRVFGKVDTDIRMKEVVGAVSWMGNGKASGVDDVKAEYLKSGPHFMASLSSFLSSFQTYTPIYSISNFPFA